MGRRRTRSDRPPGGGARRHSLPSPTGSAAPRSSLPPGVGAEVRAAARPGAGEEAVDLLERAGAALDADHPDGAVEAAMRAKRLAPRSAAVREVLGLALYRAERYRDALRELLAYRRMTDRADQNHVIADCHRALGEPIRAVTLVRDALARDLPEEVRAEAAVVGAAALADVGRFEEALTLLRTAPPTAGAVRDHDLRVWYVTADILERSGRPVEAAEAFRRIARHDPDAFDAAERAAALDGYPRVDQ